MNIENRETDSGGRDCVGNKECRWGRWKRDGRETSSDGVGGLVYSQEESAMQ